MIRPRDVAAGIGISVATYQNLEKNRKPFSVDQVVKMSRMFGVTSDYLLGLEDETGNPILEYELSDLMDKRATLDGDPLTFEEKSQIVFFLKTLRSGK
jgi:transcriptional regulator with XRE-family HTH domain